MLRQLLERYKKEFAVSISMQVVAVLCGSFAILLFQKLLDAIGLLGRAPGQLEFCLQLLAGYALLLLAEYLLNYLDCYPEEILK